MQETQKTAFIAIVGLPNVGKSSILNALLKQKIAIVSKKPQTTRTKIMGVLTEQETQLVFIDTPGVHRAKNQLGKFMAKTIKGALNSVDACLFVIEANRSLREDEINLIEKFKKLEVPVVLALNKIDLIKNKNVLFEQIQKVDMLYNFSAIVPVSANLLQGINELKNELVNLALPSKHFFPDDYLTDQPEKVIVAEIIREKILQNTQEEIPHGVAVCIEKMKIRKNMQPTQSSEELLDIEATIFCEKENHKGILIGKRGLMLKNIGIQARKEIEDFLQTKINLQLWIKVKEDWRNKQGLLKNFGFELEKN